MDALNRTRRITIGAFVVVIVLVIGLLSFDRPLHHYQFSPQQMADELLLIYQVTPDEAMESMYDSTTVFVDIRSFYDYELDHIENAKNIPVANLLNKETKKLLDQWKKDSVHVVLYARAEMQANAPWMLLYQLGYTNIRTLMGGMEYLDKLYNSNLAEKETFNVEIPAYNYAEIISAASSGQVTGGTNQPKKKVVIRKKKKKVAEGGC